MSYVPWSKVAILGMVIPPLIGNPYNGYINPYYWVDDHPLLYGNNGSLDPGTYVIDTISILLAPTLFCHWRDSPHKPTFTGRGWGGLYLAAQKILLGFHGISMFDFQVISQFYSEL